jgi:hypothetical protein
VKNTKIKVIEAIKKSRGKLINVAASLGCTMGRATKLITKHGKELYNWMLKNCGNCCESCEGCEGLKGQL